MLIDNIKQTIIEITDKVNTSVVFSIEDKEHTGQSCAAYNVEKNSIVLRTGNLIKEYQGLVERGFLLDTFSFLKIIILHEVGHANDCQIEHFHYEKRFLLCQLKSISNENELDAVIEKLGDVIMKSEMNAWRFAKKYIGEKEESTFDEFVSYNVKQYIYFLLHLRELSFQTLYKKMA